MKRMSVARAIVALALLMPVAGAALAVDVGGVKLADTAELGGQKLVLNGAGIRTKVVFKVYVGSLWLPAKATDVDGVLAKAPRRIQLDLLRNLSADQLVDALVDGLQANLSAAELATLKPETDQMVAAMKAFGDVKEGDVVTLDFVDNATRIGLNGKLRATIAGAPFNAALTRIWIGEHPAQADLKRALLGGA
ncbi:MAG: chalcone isomerase family protein [Proteobacteria bacterium]|nr:chalcone isomerase family protein [Pseudomonadota bacterium]